MIIAKYERDLLESYGLRVQSRRVVRWNGLRTWKAARLRPPGFMGIYFRQLHFRKINERTIESSFLILSDALQIRMNRTISDVFSSWGNDCGLDLKDCMCQSKQWILVETKLYFSIFIVPDTSLLDEIHSISNVIFLFWQQLHWIPPVEGSTGKS